jgi:hypothetical protein
LELEEGDEQLFRYNLIGNVVHDGEHDSGSYYSQVHHEGMERWYKADELVVEDITSLQATITLSTSYMQIWERQPEIPIPEGATDVGAVGGAAEVGAAGGAAEVGAAEGGAAGGGAAAKETSAKPMDSAADPE